MLGWLRRLLTDTEALERRLAGELLSTKKDLFRRISDFEQRLDEAEQVIRRLGHQVARVEGRTSFLRSSATEPAQGASTDGDRSKA